MMDYKFKHTLRVRYSEIDGQKIVFNANYLTYLDITITEYFRELLGEDWEEFLCGKIEITLVRTEMDFIRPARFDDVLNIYCRIIDMRNSSMTAEFLISRERDQAELVKAKCVFVTFEPIKTKSAPIPESVRRLVADFEDIKLQD